MNISDQFLTWHILRNVKSPIEAMYGGSTLPVAIFHAIPNENLFVVFVRAISMIFN